MLGVVATLASCSQNEELQNMDNDGLVNITATVEDEMTTRAVTADTDDEVTRCLLEVYEAGNTETPAFDVEGTKNGNTFTFSLKLDKSKTYNFYCWADDGTSYNATDLKAITLIAADTKPGIAHSGKSENANIESGSVNIPLTHAVAKVVLKTTATTNDATEAKVELTTHTGYNAITGAVSAETKTIAATHTGAVNVADPATPAEVLTFYALVGATQEPQTVKLSYGSASAEVANVPVKADYRTILVGDLTSLGLSSIEVTATIDSDWEDNGNVNYPAFVLQNTAGSLTKDAIAEKVGDAKTATLAITGAMNTDDFKAINNWMIDNANTQKSLSLDLTGVEGLTAIPDMAFTHIDNMNSVSQPVLTSIKLPEGVIKIGMNAFVYCANLSEITLPASLKTIGNEAFIKSGLTSIDLSNVTSLGEMVFSCCTKLEKVIFFDIKEIQRFCFDGCTALSILDLSACTERAPELTQSPFNNVPFDNITVYVKDEAMKAAFTTESSDWITAGFKAEQFVVKQ